MKDKYIIVGYGTYGAFIYDNLVRKGVKPNQINVYDISNKSLKTSNELGFKDFTTPSSEYKGNTNGRFFGPGGTSNKWGGQFFFFNKYDASRNKIDFIDQLNTLTNKWKSEILDWFSLNSYNDNELFDKQFSIRNGYWLSPWSRRVQKRSKFRPSIINKGKLVKIISKNKSIEKLIFCDSSGKFFNVSGEFYFICPGALEHSRLFMQSKLICGPLPLGDHVSKPIAVCLGSPTFKGIDFSYKFNFNGLLTKRIVGNLKNINFYIHPVFNEKNNTLKILKDILINKKFSRIKNLSLNSLVWLFIGLFRRKIQTSKEDSFYWNLDLEVYNKNSIYMTQNKDNYNCNILEIDFKINDSVKNIFKEIESSFLNQLEVNEKINLPYYKYEDIYHPYGSLVFDSVDKLINYFNNGIIVSTANLPISGSINPTASLYPIFLEKINQLFHEKNNIN